MSGFMVLPDADLIRIAKSRGIWPRPSIDGNEIWEALFGILKGDVPDEMTEDVCQQLADALCAALSDSAKAGA